MVRVLQLMSCDGSGSQARGAEILSNSSDREFQSVLARIGPGGELRNVAHAAVRLRFGRHFNVIHAWDHDSLIAGVGSGLPVILSVPPLMRRGSWGWLAAMAYADIHIVADSHSALRAQCATGIPPKRCHLIPPGIDPTRSQASRDEQLRAELGIAPADKVVLLAGESEPPAGHKLALHAVSILHVLDERWRLLIWGRGREVDALERLSGKLRQSGLIVNAQRRLRQSIEFDPLTSVADCALLTPHDNMPMLPLLLCAACGLPVVAAPTRLTGELFPPDSPVLARAFGPRALAQRLLELSEDPVRATELATTSRSTILSRFPVTDFIARHRALYLSLTRDVVGR